MRLPSQAKIALAKTMCHPVVGRLLALVTRDRFRSRGALVDTSSPLVVPALKASVFWGFYESAEARFVQAHLPPQLDVVELGASLGVVSAHVARRQAPGRRLICVEANAPLLPIIERNVRLNAPDAALRTIGGAVAYGIPGLTVTFTVTARSVDSRLGAGGGERTVEVPVLRLRDLLAQEGLGDYALVTDIEGAEAGLLAEDGAALDRCQFLIAELHATEYGGRSVTVGDLVTSLERLGFAIVDRHGPVVAARRVRKESAT